MYSLDYLFISITDIVDDLPDIDKVYQFQRELKGILYKVVIKDIPSFVDILYKYRYPNLTKESKMNFYEEVYRFYTTNYEYNNYNPNHFLKEVLRQILKSGCRIIGGSFLENNEELILHNNFEVMYVDTPMNFPNCNHVFDEETDVMRRLEELDSDYRKKLRMSFKKSESDIFIQLSDVISGFSAKLDNVIFTHNIPDLISFVKSLNCFQFELLSNYIEIVKKSEDFCIMFNHLTVPEIYRSKYRILLKTIREKNFSKQ